MQKPSEEMKPWGSEIQYVLNQNATVKILRVNDGEELSLQRHKMRDEYWRILSGTGYVIIGNDKIEAKAGMEFTIGREVNHRISCQGETLEVLEISTGIFDKNDIIRLEDKYGRA